MTAKEMINSVADKTARVVVSEMKRSGLIKENKLGSFKKTEKILYCYFQWCDDEKVFFDGMNREQTKKFGEMIKKAFDISGVVDDPYFDIIVLKYDKKWTHEKIAEYFDVDVSVISKRRAKLINQLRPLIYSDDFIKELFEL